MGIIVDIIIVLVILLCIYQGYRKGLVGMLFSIATFFIAGLLALVLMNPVANLIVDNTQFDETIENTIVKYLDNSEEGASEEETENEPGMIESYIEEYSTEMKHATVEVAAQNLSLLIIKILVFIGVYFVAKLILRLLNSIINVVAKLPLLKQFNKGGGILVGVIKGIFITYVVLGLFMLLSTVLGDLGVYDYIKNSTLGSVLYSNNILLIFIFNLF